MLVLATLVVTGSLLIYLGWTRFKRDPAQSALGQREDALRSLGAFLSQEGSVKRCVVVGNPFLKLPQRDPVAQRFEAASLRGLKRGLGEGVILEECRYPALTAEAMSDPSAVVMPPGVSTPLSFMVRRGAWDDLLKGLREDTVVISLIGIPSGLSEQRWWRDEHGPRLALVLPDYRVMGEPETVASAFTSGKILAALEAPSPSNVKTGLDSSPEVLQLRTARSSPH